MIKSDIDPDFFKPPSYIYAWAEDGEPYETAEDARCAAAQQPAPVLVCVSQETAQVWVVEVPCSDGAGGSVYETAEFRTREAACLAVALAWIEIIARDLCGNDFSAGGQRETQ